MEAESTSRRVNSIGSIILAALLALCLLPLFGCGSSSTNTKSDSSTQITTGALAGQAQAAEATVEEGGSYTSPAQVAAYIHRFEKLPANFISKTKARKAGWVSSKGNLDDVLPGMSIGGSRFNDDDEALPAEKKRTWTECDVNYSGGFRGAERIIFSDDGLVFYTDDHYKTFEQVY